MPETSRWKGVVLGMSLILGAVALVALAPSGPRGDRGASPGVGAWARAEALGSNGASPTTLSLAWQPGADGCCRAYALPDASSGSNGPCTASLPPPKGRGGSLRIRRVSAWATGWRRFTGRGGADAGANGADHSGGETWTSHA